MPTQQQIRDAIKTKMLTVAGVGVVNTYQRYAKAPSGLSALYVTAGQLLGWNIRRVKRKELFIDTGRWVVFNEWRIRGFIGLEDSLATEQTLDTLIEGIGDAFRADDTLGGLLFSCNNGANNERGIQVLDEGPVLFAGVLCNSAELGLTTQHLL